MGRMLKNAKRSQVGPQELGKCWDVADERIRHYTESMKTGKGDPAVCKNLIDKWLDYRHRHGPNDVVKL